MSLLYDVTLLYSSNYAITIMQNDFWDNALLTLEDRVSLRKLKSLTSSFLL